MSFDRARVAGWVEARQNCTGTLRRPHSVNIDEAPIDPDTLRPAPPPDPDVIYVGRASVGQAKSGRPGMATVGDRESAEVPATVGFPLGTDPHLGDLFTVDAVDDDADPTMIGRVFRVERVRGSTHRVRVACECSEYTT